MINGKFSKERVLLECISSDRQPTPGELDDLARRVWDEMRLGVRDWSEVAIGSEAHRRTMSIARAAVGLEPTGKP